MLGRRQPWSALAAGVLLGLSHRCTAENWAVIVVGSRGYMNYRHQADGCHAYHIVTSNGISPSNVILMSYDDAADSGQNPFPGKLFNKPTPVGVEGWDVREGCEVTYSGQDVNADNFHAVLRGNNKTTEGRPVLQSGPDDRVFVYFADHGGVGLVSMPVGPPVFAADLADTLRRMHADKMYKELVFYMEACESGSMFEGLLPPNVKIFATTAANAQESSWGTYCGFDAKVNGVDLETCLGDLYSVLWMEDSDLPASMQSESLMQQYTMLEEKTKQSHVMLYGDETFETDLIEWFQGKEGFIPHVNEHAVRVAKLDVPKHAVESRDIPLFTLTHQVATATDPAAKAARSRRLFAEMQHREASDRAFSEVARHALLKDGKTEPEHHLHIMGATHGHTSHDCHKEVVLAAMEACGQFTDYSMKHVRILSNLCETGHTVDNIRVALQAACPFGATAGLAPALA